MVVLVVVAAIMVTFNGGGCSIAKVCVFDICKGLLVLWV